MFDIGLGQIEGNKDYNFSKKYDEDNEIFSQNMNSCKYYEIEEISKIFLTSLITSQFIPITFAV